MTFLRKLSAQLTPAFKQMAAHVALVFVVAFAGTVTAGLTGKVDMPTLLALLIAGSSAGLTAVVHYLLGFIPTTPTQLGPFRSVYGFTVPAAVETKLAQVGVSVLATFLVILGTSALAAASSVGSVPGTADVIVAALASGVTGGVQYLTGLLPKRLQ